MHWQWNIEHFTLVVINKTAKLVICRIPNPELQIKKLVRQLWEIAWTVVPALTARRHATLFGIPYSWWYSYCNMEWGSGEQLFNANFERPGSNIAYNLICLQQVATIINCVRHLQIPIVSKLLFKMHWRIAWFRDVLSYADTEIYIVTNIAGHPCYGLCKWHEYHVLAVIGIGIIVIHLQVESI